MKQNIYIFDTDGTLIDSAQARIIAFKEAVQTIKQKTYNDTERDQLSQLEKNLEALHSSPVHNMTDLFKPGKVFAECLMEARIYFPEDAIEIKEGATEPTKGKTQFTATFKEALLAFEKKDIAHPSEDGCTIPDKIGGVSTTKSLAMRITMEAIRIFRNEFEQGERHVPLVPTTMWLVAKYIQSRNKPKEGDVFIAWSANNNVETLFYNSLKPYAEMSEDDYNRVACYDEKGNPIYLHEILNQTEIKAFLEKTAPQSRRSTEQEAQPKKDHVISTYARGCELFGVNTGSTEENVFNQIIKQIDTLNLGNSTTADALRKTLKKLVDQEEGKHATPNEESTEKVKKATESLLRKSPLLAIAELCDIAKKRNMDFTSLLATARFYSGGDSFEREFDVTKELHKLFSPFNKDEESLLQTEHQSFEWENPQKAYPAPPNNVTIKSTKILNFWQELSEALAIVKRCISDAKYCLEIIQASPEEEKTANVDTLFLETFAELVKSDEEITTTAFEETVTKVLNNAVIGIKQTDSEETNQPPLEGNNKTTAIQAIVDKLTEDSADASVENSQTSSKSKIAIHHLSCARVLAPPNHQAGRGSI